MIKIFLEFFLAGRDNFTTSFKLNRRLLLSTCSCLYPKIMNYENSLNQILIGTIILAYHNINCSCQGAKNIYFLG